MQSGEMTINSLRVEYRDCPIGIQVERPRLSWVIEATGRGRAQSAYQIVVGTSADRVNLDAGELWDSGRVECDATMHVVYGGKRLVSQERAWWKVRVWDETGQPSAWSEAAFWEAGLLKLVDWTGTWIAHPHLEPDAEIAETRGLGALIPPPMFRVTFDLSRPVQRARLYATAHGVYEAFLNGERVGNQVLAPGWTDYNKRVQYQTYDVASQLRRGENVIGSIVAPGWYAGYVGWKHQHAHYGSVPQFLAQLVIDYDDGTSETIVTNDGWRTDTGALRYADLLMGEYRDVRREQTGWSRPGFDDAAWLSVNTADLNAVPLVGDCAEPVRALDELVPKSVVRSPEGGWIFDLGQNIAGRVRLRATAQAGTKITLRFAEILEADGRLHTANLRDARVTDTLIMADSGDGVFEPSFTWHGFRFIEVLGLPQKPALDALIGVFIGSDIGEAWSFSCSDELVNQLQRNIDWGQRGNFLSIPTDCPQRDERLGWTGDAQIFAGTAIGNRNMAAFFTKWMQDLVDAQSPAGAFPDVAPRLVDLNDGAPAWADCGVILPWTMWHGYGDTRIIDQHWQAMTGWMNWLLDGNPDLRWTNNRNHDFGEWLSIGADTPKEVIATAFWAYDARLMAEMAAATGRTEATENYTDLFERICAAFVGAYVDDEGHVLGETQACYLLALHFALLPESLVPRAVDHLVQAIAAKDNHLSTGFVGCSYLLPVLSAHGHADLAYTLLHNESFPGWKYSILHGATTIWERWDGWTEDNGFQNAGMNSFNHYSFGSVGEWIKNSLVGIGPVRAEPGYVRVRIAPVIHESLTFAEGTYQSARGPIHCRWDRDDQGSRIQVRIPANVTADVHLPTIDRGAVQESGSALDCVAGVTNVRELDDALIVTTGSGTYTFTVAYPT